MQVSEIKVLKLENSKLQKALAGMMELEARVARLMDQQWRGGGGEAAPYSSEKQYTGAKWPSVSESTAKRCVRMDASVQSSFITDLPIYRLMYQSTDGFTSLRTDSPIYKPIHQPIDRFRFCFVFVSFFSSRFFLLVFLHLVFFSFRFVIMGILPVLQHGGESEDRN
jgi:hypothetical protein